MNAVKTALHRIGAVHVRWECGSSLTVAGFEAWWVVGIVFTIGVLLGTAVR